MCTSPTDRARPRTSTSYPGAALEGLMAGVDLVVFSARAGEQIEDRWAILGDDWLRYALYLIIGLAAGYILRLAARGEVTHEWPTLMLRAVLVYLPVSLVRRRAGRRRSHRVNGG